MTTREMTAAEHAQTARDFLAVSDREFAAGDHLQGSEKLYGAATQAVIAICQQRGWRYPQPSRYEERCNQPGAGAG